MVGRNVRYGDRNELVISRMSEEDESFQNLYFLSAWSWSQC
jgi:hypothetical protein